MISIASAAAFHGHSSHLPQELKLFIIYCFLGFLLLVIICRIGNWIYEKMKKTVVP